MSTLVLLPIMVLGQLAAPSGAGAEVALKGPERIEAGNLAVIRLEAPEEAQAKWLLIGPEGIENCWIVLENGRVAVFASRQPARLFFICAVSYGGKLELLSHTLENGHAPPSPGPGPEPEPAPGRLAQLVKKLAEASVDPPRRSEALRLAAALEQLAGQLRAAPEKPLRQAREQVRADCRRALGAAALRWEDFSERLAAEIAKQPPQNTLEYAAVLEQIAQGLRQVTD